VTRQRGLGEGDLVGERFRLLSEIAEGGMGRVFEAEDLRYQRRVAVKLISRRLARDPEFRARFEREAQAAARANHPNVLPVFDHGSEAGYLYMATQLADTDLGYVIEERGRLDVESASAICGQVAWALDWAHARNVFHRDVKPENILLVTGEQSTHAYLADFGLARISDSVTLTQHGMPVGLSPAYAAPEQWIGETITAATDQYALAASLYCCLAGHPPFPDRGISELRDAHLLEPPPPLDSRIAPEFGAISAALAIALSKDPADRFDSCQELITAVKAAGAMSASPSQMSETVVDPRSQTENEFPAGAGSATAGLGDEPGGQSTVLDVAPQPPAPVPPAPEPDRAPPAPPAPGPGTERPHPRRRVALIAAAVAAVAAVALIVVLVVGGGSDGGGGGGSGRIAVGASPQDIVGQGTTLWVANQRAGTLSRISAADEKAVGGALAAVPSVSQLAAGDGVVWALSPTGMVAGYDATSGQPIGPALALNFNAFDVAAGHGALWIANGTTGQVVRVAINGQVLADPDKPVGVGAGASGISVGTDRVWVASPGAGQVSWLDPDDGHVISRARVGRGVEDVVATATAVWVANPQAGLLERLDPRSGQVRQQVHVPATNNVTLTADGNQVAYVDLDSGVPRVTDAGGRWRALPSAGRSASAAALTAHKLWITYPSSNSVAIVPI
jgi:serine/threonine-protein kinase